MKAFGLFLLALLILTAVGIAPNRSMARGLMPVDSHTCLPDDDHPAPLTPCPKPPQ